MIIENKFSTIEIANQLSHLIHLIDTQLIISKYANTSYFVKNQVCANYEPLKLIFYSQTVCIAFLEKVSTHLGKCFSSIFRFDSLSRIFTPCIDRLEVTSTSQLNLKKQHSPNKELLIAYYLFKFTK